MRLEGIEVQASIGVGNSAHHTASTIFVVIYNDLTLVVVNIIDFDKDRFGDTNVEFVTRIGPSQPMDADLFTCATF